MVKKSVVLYLEAPSSFTAKRRLQTQFRSCIIVDIFNASCTEIAVQECNELYISAPNDTKFDAKEYDQYCRYDFYTV